MPTRGPGPAAGCWCDWANLEDQKRELELERERADRDAKDCGPLPSAAEVKALARQAFDNLAAESPEFGRLLRRLILRIEVRPYRLCDGGSPVLRAHFTF